ncbi:MAG: hypothetical protein AAF577_00975 [Pseudomonadota bacterium]
MILAVAFQQAVQPRGLGPPAARLGLGGLGSGDQGAVPGAKRGPEPVQQPADKNRDDQDKGDRNLQ